MIPIQYNTHTRNWFSPSRCCLVVSHDLAHSSSQSVCKQARRDSDGSWQDTCQAWTSDVFVFLSAGVLDHGVQGVGQGEGKEDSNSLGRFTYMAGR